jgi:vitamin B12/bleomycin/antimicrobial peptide transport system ATP-binding/permease protein
MMFRQSAMPFMAAGHRPGGRSSGIPVGYRGKANADCVSPTQARANARPETPPVQFNAGESVVATEFRPPDIAYTRKNAARECVALLRDLCGSPARITVGLLSFGILLVLIANVAGQIRLNSWNGSFFDAIAQKNLSEIWRELLVFMALVGTLLSLVVSQTWMQQMLKVRLREWLTKRLLDDWLAPARAYRLGLAGELGVNPDQRIQEDTRKFTELSAGLAVGFLQASVLLISFIGVLWSLSTDLVLPLAAHHLFIPGYMVWCAIAYALAGSLLTWRVGQPLIGLNAELYAREADLRFALVRVSESAESISLFQGEQDERRQLESNVDRAITTMRLLTGAISRLTWITSGYGWLAIIVPTLVALPAYFTGQLTLGGLMVVIGAFNQVQASLRWFVDQFPGIADWRATLYRVVAFKAAIDKVARDGEDVERINVVRHPKGKLAFDNVSILFSDGRVVIAEATAEIDPGERVLIVGESGAGKSTLFRALAGLWPWGTGTILLPNPGTMMFMPQRPYLPLGGLRAALAYPKAPDAFSTDRFATALRRVGLSELLPSLDGHDRLDKTLSLGQQQLIGFARLLLHRPAWVFLDEATSALDELSQRRVMSIFDDELSGAAILSIAHRPGLEVFHDRVLHLVRTPLGATLHRGRMDTKAAELLDDDPVGSALAERLRIGTQG